MIISPIKPIGMLICVRMIISFLSVLTAISFIVRYVNNDVVVQGRTGTVASLWFMFGCVISAIGVIGIYVVKAFDETKQRPFYILNEVLTDKGNGEL